MLPCELIRVVKIEPHAKGQLVIMKTDVVPQRKSTLVSILIASLNNQLKKTKQKGRRYGRRKP
jgi:hypothetical protein